jgi:hypothetical protein
MVNNSSFKDFGWIFLSDFPESAGPGKVKQKDKT